MVLLYSKINIAYSMEHGKEALDVAQALAQNNINQAEQMLQHLRNLELSEQQYRDINDIINRSLETHRVENYQVQNLELQNAGNTPTFNFHGLLLTLIVIGTSLLTIYLIMRYWEDVREFLVHSGRRVAPLTLPAIRAIVLARSELVRDNPQAVQEIINYLNSITEE